MKEIQKLILGACAAVCVGNADVSAMEAKNSHLTVDITGGGNTLILTAVTSGYNDTFSNLIPTIEKASARVTAILESHGYEESDIFKSRHPAKLRVANTCLQAYKDTLEEEGVHDILVTYMYKSADEEASETENGFFTLERVRGAQTKRWNDKNTLKILLQMLYRPTISALQKTYHRSYPIVAYALFTTQSMMKGIALVNLNMANAYKCALSGEKDPITEEKIAHLKGKSEIMYKDLSSVIQYRDPLGGYAGHDGEIIQPLDHVGRYITAVRQSEEKRCFC